MASPSLHRKILRNQLLPPVGETDFFVDGERANPSNVAKCATASPIPDVPEHGNLVFLRRPNQRRSFFQVDLGVSAMGTGDRTLPNQDHLGAEPQWLVELQMDEQWSSIRNNPSDYVDVPSWPCSYYRPRDLQLFAGNWSDDGLTQNSSQPSETPSETLQETTTPPPTPTEQDHWFASVEQGDAVRMVEDEVWLAHTIELHESEHDVRPDLEPQGLHMVGDDAWFEGDEDWADGLHALERLGLVGVGPLVPGTEARAAMARDINLEMRTSNGNTAALMAIRASAPFIADAIEGLMPAATAIEEEIVPAVGRLPEALNPIETLTQLSDVVPQPFPEPAPPRPGFDNSRLFDLIRRSVQNESANASLPNMIEVTGSTGLPLDYLVGNTTYARQVPSIVAQGRPRPAAVTSNWTQIPNRDLLVVPETPAGVPFGPTPSTSSVVTDVAAQRRAMIADATIADEPEIGDMYHNDGNQTFRGTWPDETAEIARRDASVARPADSGRMMRQAGEGQPQEGRVVQPVRATRISPYPETPYDSQPHSRTSLYPSTRSIYSSRPSTDQSVFARLGDMMNRYGNMGMGVLPSGAALNSIRNTLYSHDMVSERDENGQPIQRPTFEHAATLSSQDLLPQARRQSRMASSMQPRSSTQIPGTEPLTPEEELLAMTQHKRKSKQFPRSGTIHTSAAIEANANSGDHRSNAILQYTSVVDRVARRIAGDASCIAMLAFLNSETSDRFRTDVLRRLLVILRQQMHDKPELGVDTDHAGYTQLLNVLTYCANCLECSADREQQILGANISTCILGHTMRQAFERGDRDYAELVALSGFGGRLPRMEFHPEMVDTNTTVPIQSHLTHLIESQFDFPRYAIRPCSLPDLVSKWTMRDLTPDQAELNAQQHALVGNRVDMLFLSSSDSASRPQLSRIARNRLAHALNGNTVVPGTVGMYGPSQTTGPSLFVEWVAKHKGFEAFCEGGDANSPYNLFEWLRFLMPSSGNLLNNQNMSSVVYRPVQLVMPDSTQAGAPNGDSEATAFGMTQWYATDNAGCYYQEDTAVLAPMPLAYSLPWLDAQPFEPAPKAKVPLSTTSMELLSRLTEGVTTIRTDTLVNGFFAYPMGYQLNSLKDRTSPSWECPALTFVFMLYRALFKHGVIADLSEARMHLSGARLESPVFPTFRNVAVTDPDLVHQWECHWGDNNAMWFPGIPSPSIVLNQTLTFCAGSVTVNASPSQSIIYVPNWINRCPSPQAALAVWLMMFTRWPHSLWGVSTEINSIDAPASPPLGNFVNNAALTVVPGATSMIVVLPIWENQSRLETQVAVNAAVYLLPRFGSATSIPGGFPAYVPAGGPINVSYRDNTNTSQPQWYNLCQYMASWSDVNPQDLNAVFSQVLASTDIGNYMDGALCMAAQLINRRSMNIAAGTIAPGEMGGAQSQVPNPSISGYPNPSVRLDLPTVDAFQELVWLAHSQTNGMQTTVSGLMVPRVSSLWNVYPTFTQPANGPPGGASYFNTVSNFPEANCLWGNLATTIPSTGRFEPLYNIERSDATTASLQSSGLLASTNIIAWDLTKLANMTLQTVLGFGGVHAATCWSLFMRFLGVTSALMIRPDRTYQRNLILRSTLADLFGPGLNGVRADSSIITKLGSEVVGGLAFPRDQSGGSLAHIWQVSTDYFVSHLVPVVPVHHTNPPGVANPFDNTGNVYILSAGQAAVTDPAQNYPTMFFIGWQAVTTPLILSERIMETFVSRLPLEAAPFPMMYGTIYPQLSELPILTPGPADTSADSAWRVRQFANDNTNMVPSNRHDSRLIADCRSRPMHQSNADRHLWRLINRFATRYSYNLFGSSSLSYINANGFDGYRFVMPASCCVDLPSVVIYPQAGAYSTTPYTCFLLHVHQWIHAQNVDFTDFGELVIMAADQFTTVTAYVGLTKLIPGERTNMNPISRPMTGFTTSLGADQMTGSLGFLRRVNASGNGGRGVGTT